MKEVLGVLLMALGIAVGGASAVSAAEVPPVAGCDATMKSLIRDQAAELSDRLTDDEVGKLRIEFFDALEDAGCISDTAPLLKDMRVKPHTEMCATAASAAEDFWSPIRKEMATLNHDFLINVLRPHKRRFVDFDIKVNEIKLRGGPRKALRRIRSRQHADRTRFLGRKAAFDKRVQDVTARDAYASMLIFYELISRRCIGSKVISNNSEAMDPGARVFRRNDEIIRGSSDYLAGVVFRLSGVFS